LKEVPVKMVILTASAVLLTGLAQVVLADPPGNKPAEQKILGEWKGAIGCDGRFIFRADGSYELKDYSPGPYDSAGTWKVRRNGQQAILVLDCTTSEILEEVCTTTQVKLIQLDDRSLALEWPNKYVGHYTRVKK
jgi:hypothetical protein